MLEPDFKVQGFAVFVIYDSFHEQKDPWAPAENHLPLVKDVVGLLNKALSVVHKSFDEVKVFDLDFWFRIEVGIDLKVWCAS